MRRLKISVDFSEFPGARYYEDGSESGQQFYDTVLKAAYEKSVTEKELLIIDLDGTAGYASSFLSESFGRLAETFGAKNVLRNIQIISKDEPDWKKAILEDYIPNANKRKYTEGLHA